MIKIRGWQVSPAEIEATLLSHVSIEDAAVVGGKKTLADGAEEEYPHVFIVSSRQIFADDIRYHLLERLANYKVSSIEITLVPKIPRGPSGKILKSVLKNMLEDGQSRDAGFEAHQQHPKPRQAHPSVQSAMLSIVGSLILYALFHWVYLRQKRTI